MVTFKNMKNLRIRLTQARRLHSICLTIDTNSGKEPGKC